MTQEQQSEGRGRPRAVWGAIAVVAAAMLVAAGAFASSMRGGDAPAPEASSTTTANDESPGTDQEPSIEAPDLADGATDPSAEASAEPEEDASAAPEPAPGDVPALGSADAALSAAAQAYLDARENAVSHYHQSATDWLTVVEPTMTPEGFAALRAEIGDGGGSAYAWETAHEMGLAVKVVTRCEEDPNAATADVRVLLCEIDDQVIDESGAVLPTTAVPTVWPYVGPQPSAMLELRRVGDTWRVHADLTGSAS